MLQVTYARVLSYLHMLFWDKQALQALMSPKKRGNDNSIGHYFCILFDHFSFSMCCKCVCLPLFRSPSLYLSLALFDLFAFDPEVFPSVWTSCFCSLSLFLSISFCLFLRLSLSLFL